MASVATAATSAYTPTSDAPARGGRISSLDLVRGVVMVLMAIDHVRVYSGQPAGGPTPGIFFTRWITHFVAPAFAFLAGTSIFLHARKLADVRATSRYLLTRGAFLVLLELTVIREAWTFNFDFANYELAGVIWMLGWCMILMAALVRLPVRAHAIVGGAIVALHNVMDYAGGLQETLGNSALSGLWKFLYLGGVVHAGFPVFVLYVIVPWIGVMMLGYAFGSVMTRASEERRRMIWQLGAAATVAFLLLRALDAYGDPRHWRPHPRPPQAAAASPAPTAPSTQPAGASSAQPTPAAPQPQAQPPRPPAALRFLNATKYPASLIFLLMTLGPMLLLLAAVENAHGRIANVFVTFGRVPFFFYLLHIPLIHAAACVVSLIREGHVDPWLFTNHPMNPGEQPAGYMWSLALLYLVFAVCVALLYPACRWYARVRATGKHPALSYL
jgi:uncharacterized membrane protein